jgi:hypothetical protein
VTFKSILKPEGSVMAGIATVAAVYGVYQLNCGSVAEVQLTTPNHTALEQSKVKAGYEALVLVAGLSLLTRDANIGILGGLTIIAMEINYRHAIMAHPETGKMIPPAASAYEPAQNVVPLYQQAESS